jgi:hypothetical protein
MNGGKIDGRRCAIGQQATHQRPVDTVCKFQIAVTRFQRKCMGAQPDIQWHIQRVAKLWKLWRMDVKIDKARQQRALAAKIGDGSHVDMAARRIVRRHHGGDRAIFNGDHRIINAFNVCCLSGAVAGRVEQVCPEEDRCHGCSSVVT